MFKSSKKSYVSRVAKSINPFHKKSVLDKIQDQVSPETALLGLGVALVAFGIGALVGIEPDNVVEVPETEANEEEAKEEEEA